MKVLKSYDEMLKVLSEGKDVSIDLTQMNCFDYAKSIDFIRQMNVIIKKITRSKFEVIYE